MKTLIVRLPLATKEKQSQPLLRPTKVEPDLQIQSKI